jgi:hypothetical protein
MTARPEPAGRCFARSWEVTDPITVSAPGVERPHALAELLDDRRQVRVVAAALVSYLALGAAHALGWVPIAWPCPVRWALGVPCPGCGLTRATLALLGGHPAAAIAAHPLAPLALLGGLLVVTAALLPRPLATQLAARVRRVEGAAPFDACIAVALIAVWLTRLVTPLLPRPLF